MPSFRTNAHTHLELTDLAALCPKRPVSFPWWMGRLLTKLPGRKHDCVLASITSGIEQLVKCGTTDVADISNTGLSVEPLRRSGLRGIVYLEVVGLRRERALRRLEDACRTIDRDRKANRTESVQMGLSIHAPYSSHPDLFKRAAMWCKSEAVPLCIHAAESPAEWEWSTRGRTKSVPWPVEAVAKRMKLLPSFFPGVSPIEYLADLGVLDASPLLVHVVQVDDSDVTLIRQSGSRVVHCPRSNDYLSCGRMPLEKFLENNIPTFLGTDSRASCPDLNIENELEFCKTLHAPQIPPERIGQLVDQPLPCSKF